MGGHYSIAVGHFTFPHIASGRFLDVECRIELGYTWVWPWWCRPPGQAGQAGELWAEAGTGRTSTTWHNIKNCQIYMNASMANIDILVQYWICQKYSDFNIHKNRGHAKSNCLLVDFISETPSWPASVIFALLHYRLAVLLQISLAAWFFFVIVLFRRHTVLLTSPILCRCPICLWAFFSFLALLSSKPVVALLFFWTE